MGLSYPNNSEHFKHFLKTKGFGLLRSTVLPSIKSNDLARSYSNISTKLLQGKKPGIFKQVYLYYKNVLKLLFN